MLIFLGNQPATVSELANYMEHSLSEISRQLSRLSENGLVRKEPVPSRRYELAPLGRTAISIFRPLDFIFRHGEYFRNHHLTDIPISFRREIDALGEAKIISGTGNLMTFLREIIETARKECWIMLDHPFPFGNKNIIANILVPPSLLKSENGINLQFSQVKIREHHNVPICLIFSDRNKGIICFPSKDFPDYNRGFYVEDPVGLDYLKDIWSYFWDFTEPSL
ncbi:MAG: MarR family transcriptional regulator [Candidatus Hodarchaeales archaeon]|jgi:DNA-binding MarR family transcriptional regulator